VTNFDVDHYPTAMPLQTRYAWLLAALKGGNGPGHADYVEARARRGLSRTDLASLINDFTIEHIARRAENLGHA
jgi:hypothetical protein